MFAASHPRGIYAKRKTPTGRLYRQVGRAKVGGLCPNLQITAGHINHGPGIARGLNVISRFRFGAPPTFRRWRTAPEYSMCMGTVSFCTAAREKIATKHMLPAVHSIYLATSSADDARREDKREVAGRRGRGKESEGTSFVLSRSDRKSGAVTDIISLFKSAF